MMRVARTTSTIIIPLEISDDDNGQHIFRVQYGIDKQQENVIIFFMSIICSKTSKTTPVIHDQTLLVSLGVCSKQLQCI